MRAVHPKTYDTFVAARKTTQKNQNDDETVKTAILRQNRVFSDLSQNPFYDEKTTEMSSLRLSSQQRDDHKSRRVTFSPEISTTMTNRFSTAPVKCVDRLTSFSVLPRGGDDPSIQMAVIRNPYSSSPFTTPVRSSPSVSPGSLGSLFLRSPPGVFCVSRLHHSQRLDVNPF